MRSWVERGLADGAVGLSTGLEYLPGRYADAAELAELSRPLAAAGLPYVSHLRGYGLSVGAGLAEAREIAAAAGVAVHVSHLHGPESATLSTVDDMLSAGIDLTFDTYPYRRGCTILAMVALPR
jgi:N-acyl-D-amino-acid deacylase